MEDSVPADPAASSARLSHRRSVALHLIVVGSLTVATAFLPGALGVGRGPASYWLVLPAIVAAARFGFGGAVATSLLATAVTSSVRHQLPVQQALFFVLVSGAVAFFVRRTRLADERVMAELEDQRAQAVAASVERGRLTMELERRISRDVLTGLANRDAFVAQLQQTLDESRQVSVLFVDLDDFKHVNDTLGHAVGDELIASVAGRLANATRGHDLVARFGGDEFAILLRELDPSLALRVAQRLVAELRTPFSMAGRTVSVRASGGLAIADLADTGSVEDRALELLRRADLAMYASKTERTHGVTVYHDTMQTDMVERLALESDMYEAMANHDFYLDFQPIINLRSRTVGAVEALMRWQHPKRGLVSPAHFVPVAEQTGIIVPLSIWAVREACRQLRRWDEDPVTSGLSMAVNLSARLVREPGIGSAIAREFHYAGIDPGRVVFEITESLLMEDRSSAVQTLCQLRALGTRLSVDDFGTGYSSLSRLSKLPIDEVKIDQSFVSELDQDDAGRTIVQATVAMAHGLGLRVVAEGVERERQLQILRSMGCDDGQGYFFGRPGSPQRITDFCNEWNSGRERLLSDLPRQLHEEPADVGDEAIA